MKEKILTAIKTKFPKLNLSKKRLDEISAKIETMVVDDETKIDASIDEFNGFFSFDELAKQDDTIRNLQAKLKSQQSVNSQNVQPQNEPIEEDEFKDAPPYIKALLESNKKMAAEFEQLKAEKTATSFKTKATDRLKEIPEVFWSKRNIPTTNEDLELFVEDVTKDYADFTTTLTNSGLKNLTNVKPSSGANNNQGVGKIDVDVKAFVEKAKQQQSN